MKPIKESSAYSLKYVTRGRCDCDWIFRTSSVVKGIGKQEPAQNICTASQQTKVEEALRVNSGRREREQDPEQYARLFNGSGNNYQKFSKCSLEA